MVCINVYNCHVMYICILYASVYTYTYCTYIDPPVVCQISASQVCFWWSFGDPNIIPLEDSGMCNYGKRKSCSNSGTKLVAWWYFSDLGKSPCFLFAQDGLDKNIEHIPISNGFFSRLFCLMHRLRCS